MLGYSRYAVLVIGLKGEVKSEMEVGKDRKNIDDLIYLRALDESSITFTDEDIDSNIYSERYGFPDRYRIEVNDLNGSQKTDFIHHSRVIHFKEGNFTDNSIGSPRLKPIYNSLENLLKIEGASTESLYLNGRGGLLVQYMEDKEGGYPSKGEIQKDLNYLRQTIETFYNSSNEKYIISANHNVKPMQFPVIDPEKVSKFSLQLIAGALGIPLRLLIGSERGELASSQDASYFFGTIKHRQKGFCEKELLRPAINKFMQLGILSESNEYNVTWGDLVTLKESEKVDILQKSIQILDEIYRNPSIEEGVDVDQIFNLLGLDYNKENIDRMREELDSVELDDEDEDNEEEAA